MAPGEARIHCRGGGNTVTPGPGRLHRCTARNTCRTGPAALLVSLSVIVGGCATSVQAPVVSHDSRAVHRAGVITPGRPAPSRTRQPRSGYHTVQKGDTLYSIAWRYGLDYRDLADWNNIPGSFTIYPGQVLHLEPPPQHRPAQGKAHKVTRRENKQVTVRTRGTDRDTNHEAIRWQWPTSGRLVDSDSPTSKKGVDIAGKTGQPIKAAASGDVVYSGSGLLGYGKLIIIKHNATFLSAYAHNDEIYVKEGDKVVGGQKIATMGIGNSGQPVLHFEIREKGKPIDPLTRLPKQHS
jgi:lipoprotein NlpD